VARIHTVTACLFLIAAAGAYAAPQLSLPLACVPGKTCWVANYVDLAPGSEARDYRCEDRTYDGHNGVDFAIEDEKAMRAGVAVLAAAPGRVRAVRDGVPDRNVRQLGTEAVRKIECGNGVAITHPDGWETQYCHLREGSISVRQGEVIETGQKLGLVGMSGLTEFPHVHLTVRHDGTVIDPFLGEGRQACGGRTASLWSESAKAALPYLRGVVFHAGVAGVKPSSEDIRAGKFDQDGDTPVLDKSAAVIVFAEVLGISAGDTVTVSIRDPSGTLPVRSEFPMTVRQARWFGFAGRPRKAGTFEPGRYTAEIAVRHADGTVEPASRRSFEFDVR